MAVLATPDWLYNTRDNTMDIPTRQQRTSPAIEANSQQQQQQQQPGQLQYQQQQQQHFQQQQQQLLQQQQQMLLAAQQQQSFTYPIQQQPHGSWTPNITAAPFYPSFFQQQQQPQPYPGAPGTYFDPTNAQLAAQWAYQQMMFNAQHNFPQSQRQNQQPSPNVFNPFPSGTPPPPPHRQMSADQYSGFHPYRRPNRQQSSSADGSSDRRQGPPHPPYARPDASGSSSSISSTGSRQRTNSNQSIKSSNNNHSSNSRRGSPVSATPGVPNSTRSSPSTVGAGGGSTSPNTSQPANPSPLRQPHHRSPSTSSTSTATSIRPGAPLSPSLPTSSVSTTSATATTTATITSGNSSSPTSATPRLTRPSPLSQGPFTASEKRISRDDIDLGALQDAVQREGSRSGGLKGRLRRALSFNTAQVLKEEDAVEQDDDASIKASQINDKVKGKATVTSAAPASGSSSNANLDKPPSTIMNAPDSAVDDGSSTRAPQPKKKSRAASLFNSRMNMSTDNISLSSTVSSASVMIRKLGAMGKLARRNSLAGIASLFKDKDKGGDSKDDKGKKKDKKHSAKSEASEASVSHVTAELDRMGGDWTVNSAELHGLTPAAKLARQHTLRSNAEAAAKAKEAAAAAAARDAEVTAASLVSGANKVNGNGVAGVATWDRNTATRQGSPIKAGLAGNVRINEDGTRTFIEDDDDESDDEHERHYGHHSSPSSSSSYAGAHLHSDGWDDDDDWELEGDEDVTIRGADVSSGGSRSGGSFDEDGFDHPHGGAPGYGRPSVEMEPWAVDVRRSIEKSRKPARGILRNAQSYDQSRYLQTHAAITSRGRSNSYTSTNTNAEIGPLARMPTPDPDHIDGLRHNPRSSPLTDATPFSLPPLSFESSSSLNAAFTTSPSKDLPVAPLVASSHSENQGQNRTSAIFQNPTFNSSAPALSLGLLSASTKSPPTLTHRSQTAPIKRLTFASNLSVYDTFPPAVYDRRSEPATWNRLTPALAQRIKEELNSYKMEEMEVHAASRIHTQFFV